MAKKSLSGYDINAPLLLTGASGTSGQVLTSGGADATPTWTTTSSANSASTIVQRDSAGSFSANVITSIDLLIGASASTQTQVTTNPIIVAKDAGATYTQVAIINSATTGSSDFAAYSDNGSDASGWVDMGFTGSGFNDTNYTITGKNDGYLFTNAVTGAGLTGNLVLATGSGGSTNDIIFATSGFLTANERIRLVAGTSLATSYLNIQSTKASSSTSTGALVVAGGVGVAGNLYSSLISSSNIIANASSGVALSVTGASTTNVQNWIINGGTNPIAFVDQYGRFRIGTASNQNGTIFTKALSAVEIVQILQTNASTSTGDIVQLQDSGNTVLAGYNALGQSYTGSTSTILGGTTAVTVASASSTTVATYTVGTVSTVNPFAVGQLLTAAGFTAQTYFNGTFAITAIGGSSGAWSITVAGSGFTVASATQFGTVAVPAQASISTRSAGTTGVIVRGAASQTANLLELQNSSGTVLANVNNSGGIVVATLVANAGTMRANAGVGSSGVALSSIVSNVTQGHLILQNIVTAPNSPTGGGVLYVEAGALKYYGTSGSPATIVNADGTMSTGSTGFIDQQALTFNYR